MKIGQTSLVVFLSKLLGSALGFFATIYFARELGAEVIGLYALVLTVVGWLILAGDLGIGTAIKKRLSEGTERGAYLSATIVWMAVLAFVISIGVLVFRSVLEQYISGFSQYVAISVVWFIVGILLIKLFYKTVFRTLKGERKVHIAGLLEPVQIGSKSLFQIVLVFLGYGLFGMLVGYMIGGILIGLVALYWVGTRPSIPGKRHFESLFEYAKYSWLGGLESRTFNDVDILILGIFTPTALIGVYSVAWSIAKFLSLFDRAIHQTVFPEISHISAQETKQAAAGLIEDSLAYTGLIVIPGLVGGVILGDRLLRIYGPEFVQGTHVLALLILAMLLYAYQSQLLNALNGIDRPDLAFRINAVFISLNAGLNVVLIWQYGIEGAAIASIVSVGIALGLSYRALSSLIEFRPPTGEILRQATAATLMGIIVWGALETVEMTAWIQHNALIVITLVAGGAGIYFCTMLSISGRFRSTVINNLPAGIPIVSKKMER